MQAGPPRTGAKPFSEGSGSFGRVDMKRPLYPRPNATFYTLLKIGFIQIIMVLGTMSWSVFRRRHFLLRQLRPPVF